MSLEKVLEALSSIQERLQETERSVNAVREFTINRVGESEDNRLSRIIRLLGNTEVISGAMDDRLEDALTRLTQMQAHAQQWEARISHYIALTTLAGSLVRARSPLVKPLYACVAGRTVAEIDPWPRL
jgi:hypothetical protein